MYNATKDKERNQPSTSRGPGLAYCLPAETLNEIFHFVRGNGYSNSLLPVSEVCRYWREVALDDPTLWCKPCLSHPKLIEEVLNRNKGRSLNITVNGDFCAFRGGLPVYQPFGGDINHRNHGIMRMLACVHQATKLKMKAGVWTYVYEGFHPDQDANELFQGEFPQLRHLRLDSLPSPQLCRPPASPPRRAPPGVSGCTIPLNDAGGLDAPDVSKGDAEATLRHLSRLKYTSGALLSFTHLMAHLRVRQPVQLDLEAFHAGGAPHPIRTRSVELRAWGHVAEGGYAPLDDARASSVRVRSDAAESLRSRLWYPYFALADVKAIRVGCVHGSRASHLPEYFGAVDALEALDIPVVNCAGEVPSLLATKQRSEDPQHPGLFPRLRRLKVRATEPWMPMPPAIVSLLREYLKERSESGDPLDELRVPDGSLRAAPSASVESEIKGYVRDLVFVPFEGQTR
ncbi:hypothetical protein GLOTRDRAFT_127935 [Gloeophyllum trabeum ATCC 11539]|uniref:F-box domain-containing protein n=1 Tax=Gloeophyllum trabeum (strain ATCC 11539 / FP-39264 / Madison 617) TaxID=670483 RepID=S7QDV3_GLOTA|nr:uncharacterized protein GLOTRDRAFT_127935 [Gloeophyllum trabeum ATCC 11539]EPQ57582.1 hypothetical protein GLOTRDRAFT_127935 [Gloeophyllum trabeum ATCC 11539]